MTVDKIGSVKLRVCAVQSVEFHASPPASPAPPPQSLHDARTKANRRLPTFLSVRKSDSSFSYATPRQDLPSAGEMKSGDHGLFALHRVEQFYGLSRGRNVDINTL